MSRKPQNDDSDSVICDLSTGHGLSEAVEGADAVVHCASATLRAWQYRSVDVEGTQRLVDQATVAKVSHFVYPSIVGMEGVPHPYYKPKLVAERIVAASDSGWTIVRATQFHNLFWQLIEMSARMPLLAVPRRWMVQPIDPADVAAEIVRVLHAGPSGRWPDVGGPAVRMLGDMADTWVAASGSRRRVHNFPVPGRVSHAFASGQMTCPDRPVGTVSWEAWLAARLIRSRDAGSI